MDTKWKRFSRSIPVRVVLNVLLIASIVLGGILFENAMVLVRQDWQIEDLDEEHLYGNTDLSDEVEENLKAVLKYAMQNVCLENNETNKKFLANTEKKLKEQCKHYSYRISYKNQDGKETVLSNTEDGEDKLAESPLYINYKGIQTKEGYVKEWTNQYKGKQTEFGWLQVDWLINQNCYHNSKYASFIASQLQENLALYKNDLESSLLNLSSNEFGNIKAKIYGERYLEEYDEAYPDEFSEEYGDTDSESYEETDVEEADESYGEQKKASPNEADDISAGENSKKNVNEKEKETNPFGLTEDEQKSLESAIKGAVYDIDENYEEIEITVPIAAMLGSPQEYSISFGIEKSYFEQVQGDYEYRYEKIITQREENNNQIEQNLLFLFIDGAAFIILVFMLFYVCGRKSGTEEVQYLVIDRFYTEVTVLFTIIFFFALGGSLAAYEMTVTDNSNESIFLTILNCVVIWVIVQFLCSLMRKAKGKKLYETSILYKIVEKVRSVMNVGNVTKITVGLAIVLPGIWGVLFCFGLDDTEDAYLFLMLVALLFLVGWIAGVIFLYRFITMLEKIRDGVKQVKAGDIKYQIPTNGKKSYLNQLAEDINSLSDGLENAVNEMTKSERLKTELISNVSHDIKTPLTSIITYVDLLKKEDVKPEKAKEYIEVLDQKSQRLKVLTDDLFEAAKATSGAMSMELETLDMGAFISQGIGEFTEKFEKSNLEVKSNVERERYYVKADGRLLWRIFENILSNVSKYALPDSRVYMDVRKQEGNIILTVKNISAVELNISAKELMERFTRGDRSRNTEGSGLGLNIAKSLAELQGGSFYVEIDGDLFKSVLVLPESKKE